MDDNYTKFPNIFLDTVDFDVYEFRILSIIVRKTIGYNKKSDGISLSQFMKFGKMGKPKVIKTLKILKEKKLITSKKQKTKAGAHSYTRYSLRVVSEDYEGSNPEIQGVVSEDYTHEDNNTKETIQKKRESHDIYFSLNERDKVKEVDNYIQNVINESSYIKSEKAFSVALRKKFDKKDKATLEEFERWYLEDKSQELLEKHYEENIRYKNAIYQFENIYPYFKTEGYIKENKFYILIKNDYNEHIFGFDSIYGVQTQLQEWGLNEL